MVFTEPAFLFLLLPLALLVNLFGGQRFRNLFLLILSLIFYFMGERAFVLLMLLSCGINYGFGLWIERTMQVRSAKSVLAVAIGVNLILLGLFKYTGFALSSMNALLIFLHLNPIPVVSPHLPIGISFFTFQAISYLIDVYRREVPAERKWSNLALYISLFPQLIAGPIVRYAQLVAEMHQRTIRLQAFALGAERFILGLAKKTIIANTLAVIADSVFGLAPEQLSTSLAWLGLVAYALQIYYDFSGYSDMAIGIGLMLGFRFPENFNYPYISRSMSEFWRRWHISLSTWFRDYLYIPLGGNRLGNFRTTFNLLLVFLLCGLWHGASWNFVFWGLFHGCFLMLERIPKVQVVLNLQPRLNYVYTLPVILISWVFFRCETFGQSVEFIRVLLGHSTPASLSPNFYLDALNSVILATGILFALPLHPRLRQWISTSSTKVWPEAMYGVALLVLLILSFSQVAAGTYDPFIYFRF